MPYTKEQLKNNENYERAIEASRREQISTFVKDERDFVASGSNPAAAGTLRMKSGEFVSIPEIEDDPSQKIIVKNETYYVTEDADKFVDKDIKELLNNNPVTTLTTGEFFREYEKLKSTIQSEGALESHRYLYEQALIYLNAGDELADMKAELQKEIDNLKQLQIELTAEIQENVEEDKVDAAFLEYQGKMELYRNTTKAYTRQEWDDYGQPKASEAAGWQALRFVRQPLGNHPNKEHTQKHVYVTYAGYGRKNKRKQRKNQTPVKFSVEAVGDPTLTYEWQDAETGTSVKFHSKAKYFSGQDTPTLSVMNGSQFSSGFGPVLRCKITDSSGEKYSENCEISRRAVRARN